MIKRILFVGTFSAMAIFSGLELFIFYQRSPADAEVRAQKVFLDECPKLASNCREFTGPDYAGEWRGAYKFRWKNRAGPGLFFVEISYLPIRSDKWYLPDTE